MVAAELPALTTFMLNLSNFVTSPTFAIGAPLLIFAGIFLFRGYYSSKQEGSFVDTNILKYHFRRPYPAIRNGWHVRHALHTCHLWNTHR